MVKQFFEYIKNLAADIVEEIYESEYEKMPPKEIKLGKKIRKASNVSNIRFKEKTTK
jgi:hypothetical protein